MTPFQDAFEAFVGESSGVWPNLADGLPEHLARLLVNDAAVSPSFDRLEACFRNSKVTDLIAGCYRRIQSAHQKSGGTSIDPLDFERLRLNALALVLSARAAAVAKAKAPERFGEFISLAAQVEGLLGGSPDRPTADDLSLSDVRGGGESFEMYLLDRLRQVWANQTFEAARLWIGRWLTQGRPVQNRELRVKVASVLEGSTIGEIAYLTIALVEDRRTRALEDPDVALVPLGSSFRASLDEAHQAAGRRARQLGQQATGLRFGQCPRNRRSRYGAREILSGPSLGAAARVAAELLVEGKRYDFGCLITAQVNTDDTLAFVAGEFEKLAAAKAADCTVGVIADRSNRNDPNRLTEVQALNLFEADADHRRLRVRDCATVEDAKAVASGAATDLDAYFARVMSDAETLGNRVTRLANKQLDSALYQPLRVAPLRPAGEERERELERRMQRGDSEDPLWTDVFKEFKSQGGPTLAVVGEAGWGKSEVLRHTASEMAHSGLKTIDGQAAGVGLLDVPVPMTCADFSKAGENPALDDVLSTIRNRVAKTLNEAWDSDAVSNVLAPLDPLHVGGCVWLMLDGLDEVPHVGPVAASLRVLLSDAARASRIRVLLASRPPAFDSFSALTPETVRVDLRPMTQPQTQSFVKAWFDNSQQNARRAFDQALAVNGTVVEMASNPLRLTLLCYLALQGEDLSVLSRAELYERLIAMLLEHPRAAEPAASAQQGHALANRERSHRLDLPAPGREEARAILKRIADVWFRLFDRWSTEGLRLPERDVVDELEEIYENAGMPDAAERAGAHVRRLIESRVWECVGDGGSQLQFPHREFGEFLAAYGLARELRRSAADQRLDILATRLVQPLWENTLRLTIGAYGACLRKAHETGALVTAICKDSKAGTVNAVTLLGNAVADGGRQCVPLEDREWLALELMKYLRSDEPPRKRAAAGDALARVGDPRFEGFESDLYKTNPHFEALRNEPGFTRESLKGTPWKLPVFKPDLVQMPEYSEPQIVREPMLGFIDIEAGPFWMGSTLPDKDAKE